MVISCSAYNCTRRWSKENGLTFHRFPLKNPDLLKKWVIATKRKGFIPTNASFLCELHFREDDYAVRPGTSRKKLNSEAVPSCFDFPAHLMPSIKRKRREILKNVEENKNEQALNTPCTSSADTTDQCLEVIEVIENTDLTEEETSNSTSKECASQTEVKFIDKGTETCNFLPDVVHDLRKKIKNLREKIRRRDKRIFSMTDIVSALKEKGFLTEKLNDFLEQQEGTQVELVSNLIRNSCSSKGNRFTTDIKMFAMTVYFYSPKAYEYLRTLMPLPHKSRISQWLATVNCEPGFLDDVFRYFAVNSNVREEFKDSSLVIDSMSIRKQIVWDQGSRRYTGFVDFGTEIGDSKEAKEASEALVFMIVSMKSKFKCPIGYFLVNGIEGSTQAKLIRSALERLDDHGIRIWAVTCDGTKANLSTLHSLGCNLNLATDAFTTQFPHPVKDYKVSCILDMCHMMKLARNALAEVSVIESPNGVVQWKYIEKLNELQSKEGLTFANKLSGQHINYKNKKMNVGLAVQTLSSSVADAIDFLRNIGNRDMQGSESTIEFIYYMDRIFDLMNSRNPFASGFKSALRLTNKCYWLDIFNETETYLRSLKVKSVPLLKHARSTFALGMIFNMHSVKYIAQEILAREESPLKYLLTYRMSQDHIELFFSCVRSRGGWNNNPNAYQLKCAMRKLLLGNSVSPMNGNSTHFDFSSLTPIYDFRSKKRSMVVELNTCAIQEEMEKLCYIVDEAGMSMYKQNILYYIAGYVSLCISKRITCKDCLSILRPPVITSSVEHYATYASVSALQKNAFTKFVSRGKIVETSEVVYSIVEYCEKLFHILVLNGDLRQSGLENKIVFCVVNKFAEYSFPSLSHDFHNEFGLGEDLHNTQLVRKIASYYSQMRLKTYAKRFSAEKINKNKASVRQKLHKLILFNNV